MKNLFNNLSQSEKNRILEMHNSKNVIRESQMSQQQFKAQAQKAAACFSKENTPQLYALSKGLGLGALAIGAFAMTYFSGGIGAGLTFTTGLMASAKSLDELETAINNNKSTYEAELKKLYNCVFD